LATSKKPTTWIVPGKQPIPFWISGKHKCIAVRITSHSIAMKLCHASNSSIISTSANITGKPPIKNIHVLRKQLQNQVDFILPGICGPITGPTEIRVLKSGKILRPANS
tara:strand:+ start:1739 stop:2065 length:327 start_codon:yes stop_codon:yes gene_type:complete